MKNTVTSVPYMKVPDSNLIRLITNKKKVEKDLLELINYSDDPALLAIMEYLEVTYENNKCPFVPGIHNGNLYHALLYNEGEGEDVDFTKFFGVLEPSLRKIMENYLNSGGNKKDVNFITLFAILSDPGLDTVSFSNKMEMRLMIEKDNCIGGKYVANNKEGRMAGAMLARPQGGATRTSNPDLTSDNPIGNNIRHPFQVNGFNAVAYRPFYDGVIRKIGDIPFAHNRQTAVALADFGSVRTPQNMIACLLQYPDTAQKYINLFINFLPYKIHLDKTYVETLTPEDDPDAIVMFLYEHYLRNIPSHCIDGIKLLLKSRFEAARDMLLDMIKGTEKVYGDFVKVLEQFRDGQIEYETMMDSLHACIPELSIGRRS